MSLFFFLNLNQTNKNFNKISHIEFTHIVVSWSKSRQYCRFMCFTKNAYAYEENIRALAAKFWYFERGKGERKTNARALQSQPSMDFEEEEEEVLSSSDPGDSSEDFTVDGDNEKDDDFEDNEDDDDSGDNEQCGENSASSDEERKSKNVDALVRYAFSSSFSETLSLAQWLQLSFHVC